VNSGFGNVVKKASWEKELLEIISFKKYSELNYQNGPW
jgi:hypothetical protein